MSFNPTRFTVISGIRDMHNLISWECDITHLRFKYKNKYKIPDKIPDNKIPEYKI